jgi:glycosyltransferase involved in cell wall biosynthesis
MRIAIEARELEGKPTGVGRYLTGLLRVWLSGAGDERFILYHRGSLPTGSWTAHARLEWKALPPGKIRSGLWWQQMNLARALRRDKPDVLFAPADSAPLRWRGPMVLTIHDISYEAHPEWFDFPQRWRRRLMARKAVRKADAVLADTKFTKDELITHYSLPADKVTVVHLGVDDSIKEEPFTPEEELRARLGFTGPLALMVGSIFERRFPLQTVGAFRMLGDIDVRLVIVGEDRRRRKDDLGARIRSIGSGKKVVWLDYCSDQDLKGLYRIAGMLIYLSAYEGFGLPPLEAACFGVPSIVSDRGALKEVYGDAALLVAEENEENIAAAVRRLALDRELKDRLKEAGRRLLARQSLRACAEKTLALIRSTAEQGARFGTA